MKLVGDVALIRFTGPHLVSQMYEVDGSIFQLVCSLGDRDVMEVASRVVIKWVVVRVQGVQFCKEKIFKAVLETPSFERW